MRKAREGFLQAVEEGNTNPYHSQWCAEMGNIFYSPTTTEQYDKLWKHTPYIALPQGWRYGIDLASWKGNHTSKLWVADSDGNKDFDIFKHIIIQDDECGAWLVFLLNKLWHTLPLIDHAQYNRRYYLYSKEDIMHINPIDKYHRQDVIAFINEAVSSIDITPRVYENLYLLFVECYYWNDWEGLVLEREEIYIKDHKVVRITDFDSSALLKYNCGIHF